MNTSTSNAVKLSNREFYQQRADAALRRIPGAWELLNATPESRSTLEAKYPDATFVVDILMNPFVPEKERCAIRMEAFSAILNGENLADIHRRYDRAVANYLSDHNWD